MTWLANVALAGFVLSIVLVCAHLRYPMGGMRHGPYRMHWRYENGSWRKRPCYRETCGCVWDHDEKEKAA